MSQIDISLLAIAAALFAVLAVHQLTLWRSRRDVVRSAIVDYKAAFAAELSDVRNGLMGYGTFTDAFPRHKSAVDNIMPVLPVRHQRKLQKAWDEYCGKGTDIDCDVFISGSSTHHDLYPEFKKRFCALHGCLDDLL